MGKVGDITLGKERLGKRRRKWAGEEGREEKKGVCRERRKWAEGSGQQNKELDRKNRK